VQQQQQQQIGVGVAVTCQSINQSFITPIMQHDTRITTITRSRAYDTKHILRIVRIQK